MDQERGVRVAQVVQPQFRKTVIFADFLKPPPCGDVFTAAAPEEAGEEKYDETAASGVPSCLLYTSRCV